MPENVQPVNVCQAVRMKAYYPNYFSDRQIAYVCLSLVRNLNDGAAIQADVMGLTSDATLNPYKMTRTLAGVRSRLPTGEVFYKDAIPGPLLWSIAHRILSESQIQRVAEQRSSRTLRRGDIAYLWPGASVELYKKAKSLGCVVVSERINTLRSNSRRILDVEFSALGIPAAHGITPDSEEKELACMGLADYIFSPSPAVTKSLTDEGVAPERILPTTYGLRSGEILDVSRDFDRRRPVTAIFVGRICVRKGVHLLLHAWSQSGVNGKLRIVGRIAPEISDLFHEFLARNDSVEHVDYVDDLRTVFEDADFFILPSLEEGSALVTYLALGASLPVVVSSMGAGGVVTHGKEGIVVDPHDQAQMVEAVRAMASNPALRREMSAASGAAAQAYTWDQVAARRRKLLLDKLARP